jgi:hypothetical protein
MTKCVMKGQCLVPEAADQMVTMLDHQTGRRA